MNELDTKLRVIGVAYDGSAEAQAALRQATELALESGAAIQLIGVFTYHAPPPAVGPNTIYAPPAEEERCRADFLRGLEDAAESLPPEVRAAVVLVAGDPAEQLTKRSELLSLLVMGSRGYGSFRRALLGSVSSQVLRDAVCPVLIVPRHSLDARAAA